MVNLVGWLFSCEWIGDNTDGFFYRCCPNKIGSLVPWVFVFVCFDKV